MRRTTPAPETSIHTVGPTEHLEVLRRPRILLAEDDHDIRRSLTRLLELDGYDVCAVTDGAKMLDYLSGWVLRSDGDVPPDLIITDVRMPGVSGLSIVHGLRASGWSQPIIVMSAFGDDHMRRQVAAMGHTHFLDKPFDPARLQKVVAEMTH